MIKKYHPPATPCEQLLADDRVGISVKEQLRAQFAALDPVQLLNQIRQAQRNISSAEAEAGAVSGQHKEESIQLSQFVQSLATVWRHGEVRAPYRRRRPDAKPHTWRTRADPFEDVWPMVQQWLNDEPNTTGKDLFLRLNTQIPNRFKPSQLRTFQRRVKDWRTSIARRLILGCNSDADAQKILSRIQAEPASKGVVTL